MKQVRFYHYFIGSLIILLAYSSAFLPSYMVSDDWASLNDVYINSYSVAQYALIQGRILNAAFVAGFFELFNSVEHAKYIRLIGILGTCLFVSLLCILLCRRGIPAKLAFPIAIGAAFLPPFVVVSIWAQAASMSWACVLAIVAALSLDKWLAAKAGRTRWIVLATAATFLALFSYPPAAQLIFILPALYVLPISSASQRSRIMASFWGSILVFLVAGILFVVVWKSYQTAYFPGVDLGNRVLINSPADIIHKTIWFLTQVLPMAGSLFRLSPIDFLWVGVISVCLAQFAVAKCSYRERLFKAFSWTALLFASYAANLLVEENYPAYRTQFALQTLLWISLASACVVFARVIIERFKWSANRFEPAGSAIGVGLIFLLSIRQLFFIGPIVVAPHVSEWEIVGRAIFSIPDDAKRVVVVRPEWGANRSRNTIHRYDTIGRPSSFAPWVPPPMLNVAYWTLLKRPFPFPVEHFTVSEYENRDVLPGDFTIDMNAALRENARRRDLPLPRRQRDNDKKTD